MPNVSFKLSLFTVSLGLALGGCGGSDSATGGFPSGQNCADPNNCTTNGGNTGNPGGWGGFGNFGGTNTGNTGNTNTGNTGNGTNNGGTGNGSNGTGNTTGGTGGPPPGPNCGNGTVDPDEDCDTGNLAGGTCATATMGSMPAGVLKCASNCMYDLSGCHGNGQGGGTGGTTGTGGGTGTGGRNGTGGRRN